MSTPGTITNICGYNEAGIRLSVIMPFEDGYAVAGRYAGGGSAAYGGGLALQKFSDVESAKRYVGMLNPCTYLRWEAENTAQTVDQVRR